MHLAKLTHEIRPIIPRSANNFEFGLAATLPNPTSRQKGPPDLFVSSVVSSPFPIGKGLPPMERRASIWLRPHPKDDASSGAPWCLAESKFKVIGRSWYKQIFRAKFRFIRQMRTCHR